MRPVVFAIPGDPTQRTGGFIYEWRLLHELRAAGREVRHLRLPAPFPGQSAAAEAETARSLAAIPADVPLILDGLVFGAMATAGLAALRCPVIAMLHHPLGMETGLAPGAAVALMAREGANLAHAAQVVVTSPVTARTYAQVFGVPAERITVAPPGFDRPDAAPHIEAGPRILSVGLLAERKGHDVLIRALGQIVDLDWTAGIAGKTHDPAVAAALAALVAENGLEGRVRFLGELSEAALEAEWQRARLFALATRYEGYGMVLAEAMVRGLPVVTCAAGAVPETVGDGARLVPPDDVPAFAGALRALLTDGAARRELAGRAAARGRTLPDWRETARVTGGVIDALGPATGVAPPTPLR